MAKTIFLAPLARQRRYARHKKKIIDGLYILSAYGVINDEDVIEYEVADIITSENGNQALKALQMGYKINVIIANHQRNMSNLINFTDVK